MQTMLFILCNVFALHTLIGMENQTPKEITICNTNLPELDIQLQRYTKQLKPGTTYSKTIPQNKSRKIRLYSTKTHMPIVPTINLHTGAPQYITLHVEENSPIKFGDTILVTKIGGKVEVTNQDKAVLATSYCNQVIGSANTKSTGNSHKFFIYNKNLREIILEHKAIKNEYESSHYYNPEYDEQFMSDTRSPLKSNILAQALYCLPAQDSLKFKTFLLDDFTKYRTTKLIIPQATQDVYLLINDGTIQSYDTLTICFSKDNDQTIIIKNQRGVILAKLFAYNNITNKTTIQ